MNELGKRVRNARETKKLLQADVAKKIGCSPGSVANWERGDIIPPIEMLSRLCDALEISPLDLLKKRYSYKDIVHILEKPMHLRDYEENIAVNYSLDILRKNLPEKNADKTETIAAELGISAAAVNSLVDIDFLSEDNAKISACGLDALNTLLTSVEGLQALENIALYINSGSFKLAGGADRVTLECGLYKSGSVSVDKKTSLSADMLKTFFKDMFNTQIDNLRKQKGGV